MKTKRLLCLALLFGLLLASRSGGAPAVAAEDTEVRTMEYSQLMHYIIDCDGSMVLVNFWATWCGPCLKEMPGLIKLREEIPEDKLHIVAISLDYDPKTYAGYLERNPLNFPSFLAAPDLMTLLEIQSIPKILLFDCQGMEIVSHDGYIPIEELRPKIEDQLAAVDKEKCPQ